MRKQSKKMVLLCVQIGDNSIEVEFQNGGSAYQLKKAVKSEKQNHYKNTDADQIVLRDNNGNELANLDDIADLIAAGHGKLEMPFLVDALAGSYVCVIEFPLLTYTLVTVRNVFPFFFCNDFDLTYRLPLRRQHSLRF
jgi:hypothetical protein